MLFRDNGQDGRILMRGAALLLAASALAGCSSSASRFTDGVDGIFTASVNNQRSIIKDDKAQPFPGDRRKASQPELDRNYTGTVARNAVEAAPVQRQPLERQSLPPVASASAIPDRQPTPQRAPQMTATAPSLDRTPTAPRAQPQVAAAPRMAQPAAAADLPDVDSEGWSRAGGTQIAVKDGETVFNLSRRFGVPSDAILRANGMTSASQLAAGQKVVIPTYVYTAKAKVSAPDSNPNVADAKSSRGTRYDVDGNKVPLPTPSPDQNVAVLPQSPKLREQESKAPSAPSLAANDARPKGAGGTYVVQSGDSLHTIAKKTGVRVVDLKAANGIDAGLLQVGQKLTIPAGGTVAEAKPSVDRTVTGTAVAANKPKAPAQAEAEKPAVAAYTPPVKPTKAIEQAMGESDDAAPNATGISGMRWPVRGRVIAPYANGRDGIDIAVPEGTSVKAAENGVVIYAGDGLKDFGNTVLVRHENGLVTVYGHASQIKVSRGEKVTRGQEIAKSGMSGKADTPKLRFEVRKDSTPVDPGTYLQ